MRLHSLLATTTVCAWMASTSLAGTIIATADNRQGTIQASDGNGDPVQSGFNITPGENEFQPIAFNQCATDGGRQGCINLSSSYLDLGFGNTTTGLTATGSYSVTKPLGAGYALSDTLLSFGFTISGLASGQTEAFDWEGSLAKNGGLLVVHLTGPGLNVTLNETTSWDQVLQLTNGTYILTVQAQAFSNSGSAFNASGNFSVMFAQVPPPPPECNASAGSCYGEHPTPGCNDTTCCGAVCAADPFCCSVEWDGICVAETGDYCALAFVTNPVPNPLNGHWYRLAAPASYSDTVPFLLGNGYFPASITNPSENAWVTRNIASNVPGLLPNVPRIGLTDLATEGAFVWATGEPTFYTNWAAGEPNNFGDEDSVQIGGYSGVWNDISVTENLPSVGEAFFQPCGVGGSCFTTHGPGCNIESCCNEVCFLDPFCCNNSWDELCVSEAQQFCTGATVGQTIVNPATRHKYIAVSNGSWLQAQKLAMSMGGHLVSMNSAAENEWVRANFPAIRGNPSQYLIGFNDHAIEGAFQWTSHEAVSFSNWSPGEPNNLGGEDVVILESDGRWNDLTASVVASAIIEIPCVGDFNGDGAVGGSDLAVLLGAWGNATSQSDLNQDSKVDAADLAILLGAWGPCPTSNACFANGGVGSDQPGCTICVCGLDPFCCDTAWDGICAGEAASECNSVCQCGG